MQYRMLWEHIKRAMDLIWSIIADGRIDGGGGGEYKISWPFASVV